LYRRLNPPTVIEARIPEGVLYLTANSAMTLALENKSYEDGTTRLFRDLIKPDMTVVDIGANVGYYTLIAGRLVGPKGRVFAFEPAPETFDLLSRCVATNRLDNVEAVQAAVAEKSGTAKLFLSPDPITHSLYGKGELGSVEVPMISLDSFLRGHGGRVDVVKIDVEGGELKVIEGMRETIRLSPGLKIFTELSAGWIERVGLTVEDFLRKLADFGLKSGVVNEADGSVNPAEAGSIHETLKHADRVNLLCVPDPGGK
jgi:FkbM family methyltransferase